MFSDEVAGRLSYYVYRLIHPATGETFYVGKGRGNRIFHHALGQTKLLETEADEDELALKIKVIRAIQAVGNSVVHAVHRHGMDEKTAFEVEAALIDAYPGLTNQQLGHDSGDRGCMTPDDIIQKYDLPALNHEPNHRLILININSSYSDGSLTLLEKVQCEWVMSTNRARKADYVLAVARGVVRGVFKPEVWVKATSKNFPMRLIKDSENRIGFLGYEILEGEIRDELVGLRGKRIEAVELRNGQNPIRYWNM